MNEQQFDALHQTLIDYANDMHDVSEAVRKVRDYFNGVIPDSFLAGRIRDLNLFLRDRDRDSILGTALGLHALVHDLTVIRDSRPDLHGKFRSAAKRSKDADYFGHRMEIKAAADLIKKGVLFSRQESPDFIAHGDYAGAAIECTSAHFDKLTGGDVMPKIVGAIRGKSQKPYANRNVAVYVDITNVLHNGVYYMELPAQDQFPGSLEAATRESNLGAVTILTSSVNIDRREILRSYRCFKHPSIGAPLYRLMDTLFPTTGTVHVDLTSTMLIP